MQFKAGYISDPINKILKSHLDSLVNSELNDKNDHLRYKGLLQYVTSFDIEFPFKHNSFKREIHPILAVVNNIISRGLPTKAPLVIETVFNEIGLIEKNETTHEIGFRIRDKNFTSEEIFRLFHFIDPDLIISQGSYGGNLGSQLEWQFISQYPILAQVLESQRDFSSISSNLRGGRSVDFSYVSPYLIWNEKEKREENLVNRKCFKIRNQIQKVRRRY
jgi:ATP-dependent DNA helicase RecQ